MADEEKTISPAQFFNNWANKIEHLTDKLGQSPNRRQILKKLSISNDQFKKLLKILKEDYQLIKKSDQPWADFFRQVSLFFAEDNEIENAQIKLDSEQPTKGQLEELLAEKEAFESKQAEIKEKIKSRLQEKLNLDKTEVDRYLQRLVYLQKMEIGAKDPDIDISSHEAEDLAINSLASADIETLTQKTQLIERISAELPKDYRTDIPTSTTIANHVLKQEAEIIKNQAKSAGIPEISYPTVLRLSTFVPSPKEKKDKQEVTKKVEKFVNLMSQLGVKEEESETILNQISQTRKELLGQETTVEKVKRQLIENQLPPKKAEKTARQAVKTKKKKIQKKIKEISPELEPETKTKITTAALTDNYEEVKKAVKKIKDLPKTDQKDLAEGVIESNAFIAARETIAHQLKNPPQKIAATVPESFQEKLDQHPQVTEQIAGLIVTRASQGVAKENILPSIIVPTAIAVNNQKMPVEEGEEEALKQTFSGLTNTTLKMVALSEEEYYQSSALNDLEEQISTYLGNKISIREPDGTIKYFDLSGKVNRKAVKLMADFWVRKPTKTSQEFLNLKIEKDEAPLSTTLEKLPSGDPTEILANLNADENPSAAAAVAAQLAQTPPDQLQENISAWQEFTTHLKEIGQEDLIVKNKLLATMQTWYGEKGVAEQVYQTQLYQTYQGIRQVFSPFTNFVSGKIQPQIKKLLGNTALGKGIKTLWDKGKSFLKEKIFDPIKNWALKQVGEKIAKEGIKIAAKEGVKAALAAAGTTVSFGVTAAIWVGEKILKAGYSLFKKGLKAVGLDKAVDKFNQLTSFGLAPKLDKAVDKVLFFLPAFAKDFVKFFNRVFEGIVEVSIINTLIVPAIAGVFIVLFFLQLFVQGPVNLTMAPPLMERGGRGVPEPGPGGDIAVLDVDVDLSQCENYSGNVKDACIATIVLQACFPEGINSTNVGANGSNVETCLKNNSDLTSGTISHMVNEINASATAYTYLQCVGYKRAVESQLPYGVGDAKDYTSACNAVSKSQIKPGDNAVWTSGSFGHIAIVIDPLPNDPNSVLVAQAWGGKGNINFKKAIIASISQFIRCN